jgi:transformation/transcription domain-associated protein
LDQDAALIESGMAARIPVCGGGSTDMADDNASAELGQDNLDFINHYRSSPLSVLLGPLRHLVRVDEELAHSIWIDLFPKLWISQTGRQRHDLTKALIPLLSKEYHIKQAELRPNVIQTLLDGICECTPVLQVPPQLLQYLGKSYNAWHSAIELLKLPVYPVKSGSNINTTQEEDKIREGFYDSLVDLYSCLEEDDMVYGLWRNRCLFQETNAALSYEQIGMWSQAQTLYEAAQTKARSGVMPFSESEYNLWEAKWVECAERLQQWDILADLSKNESDSSLMLESAWRLSDWQAEREMLATNVGVMQDNEIRKQIYESFLLLQNYNDGKCSVSEVQRTCDEGVQLVMHRWIGLPSYVSEAHIPLLHDFQLFVEMTEACQIITNLQSTNAGNIDSKSQELKGILQVWRDRLPNEWDDINLWSDIVSWRQHVFSIVNKSYLPLIPHLTQPSGAGGSPTSSYAYRGYHETAWIINRFAHVTRKHQLTEVCVNALSKIYTLPNIEIQEAFYKLREQAKCHFQSATEYSAGLDVINNTNLLYFTTSQKAEFFAMKGAFLNKLNLHEDASQAFSSAVQIDMNLPKSWGAWGQYNDRMFKENPTEIKYASNAVNCFLHASGLYNNARSRKYIARILWLLSVDDAQFTVAKAFDAFKGELPIWFWITFIPQLLTSLGGKEARLARQLLMKISKSHPQVRQVSRPPSISYSF